MTTTAEKIENLKIILSQVQQEIEETISSDWRHKAHMARLEIAVGNLRANLRHRERDSNSFAKDVVVRALLIMLEGDHP